MSQLLVVMQLWTCSFRYSLSICPSVPFSIFRAVSVVGLQIVYWSATVIIDFCCFQVSLLEVGTVSSIDSRSNAWVLYFDIINARKLQTGQAKKFWGWVFPLIYLKELKCLQTTKMWHNYCTLSLKVADFFLDLSLFCSVQLKEKMSSALISIIFQGSRHICHKFRFMSTFSAGKQNRSKRLTGNWYLSIVSIQIHEPPAQPSSWSFAVFGCFCRWIIQFFLSKHKKFRLPPTFFMLNAAKDQKG